MNEEEFKLIDTLIAEEVLNRKTCKCDHHAIREAKRDKFYEDRKNNPLLLSGCSFIYYSHGSDKTCNNCGLLYINACQYSTDIRHAWDVMEEIRKNNTVTIHSETITGRWLVHVDANIKEIDDSAPLAICLAALNLFRVDYTSRILELRKKWAL